MIVTVAELRRRLNEGIYDPTGYWAEEKRQASAFVERVSRKYGAMAGLRALGDVIGSRDPDAFAEMYLRQNGGDPFAALEHAASKFHPNKLRKAEKMLGEGESPAPCLARLF
jgi:hypothetical protein